MATVIFIIAGDGFRYACIETNSLSPTITLQELVDGIEVQQRITVPADRFDAVSVYSVTYSRQNTGIMHLSVIDSSNEIISEAAVDISNADNWDYLTFSLSPAIEGKKGDSVTLQFSSKGCSAGNAITFCAGNTVETARASIETAIDDKNLYLINHQPGTGMLCIKTTGINYLRFYIFYWPCVLLMYAFAAVCCSKGYKQMLRGEKTFVSCLLLLLTKYRFLVKQLVFRDFKNKYKRSVLGVVWSFLNPLLTMIIQYIVFSSVFKSSVANFPVYLLTGTVFFNFFSEAVSLGMTSIVSSASLIKKVYVPIYIYPISRVLSSLVNFVLAFLPLLLVMIITRTPFHVSTVLLVFDIICFFGFITGLVLVLSTALVFFQDVQFLWGVVSLVWMYLTPIFYPETIIPAKYLFLYHLNPLYQYINFARTSIITGISPHPIAYLGCLLPAVVMLFIGAAIFKKNQDYFIMYI